MLTGWKYCTLGDVLTLQRGFDLPGRDRREGDIPIISSSGITGYHIVAKVHGPGVVTGRYGTLGEVFYIKGNFWPLNTTLYVRDFKGNDPLFLSYFLRTLNLAHQNSAGAVPGLNRNALHLLPVYIPPLPTQRKIAGILSAYDDLIENNTRRIAILEEIAQSLYQEWFVHFRFPGHEQMKMVESELGMIPEGWRVVRLRNVATIHRGRSYTSDNLREGGLPFLNLKCIERDGGFRYDGIKRYQGPYRENQTAKAGDIIMAVTDVTQERRLIARAARVPKSECSFFVFSMDLVKIVPKDEIYREYLYSMLRFSNFSQEVKQYANGANVLHLAPERIEDYVFSLPPTSTCASFLEICASIHEECDTLQLKNANLCRTRDLLLPKLISGEIDVETWDAEELAAVNVGRVAASENVERQEETDLNDSGSLARPSLWG